MSQEMDAAVLTDVGEMHLEAKPRPQLESPEDVIVRIGACGVCMTDYHIYHGAFEVEPPVVLGHESAGEVVATGSNVTNVEAGELVAINPLIPCGTCEFCRNGRQNMCRAVQVIGGAGDEIIDGAFAEYVRVPASCLEPIGDLPVEHAALSEPLGCCIHGADRAPITTGDTVALIGAGPIGLLLLQVYRNRGAGTIVVSELDEQRRTMAARLGADHVIDPNSDDPVRAVETIVGKADVAAEVVGRGETIQQAREMTKRGGRTLIFGVPPQDLTWEISPFEVYFREMDIVGTYSLTEDAFRRAITLLRNDRIEVGPLLSAELSLPDVTTAFQHMENTEGYKNLIIPGSD